MTIAADGTTGPGSDDGTGTGSTQRAVRSSRAAWMAGAGMVSLGAGAIHAAAIGVHAETRPAALAFTAIAALQLLWGGVALVRSGRAVALTGIVLGIGAVAGWAMAKTAGIGLIEGLDVAEPVQLVDGLAAAMAGASALFAAISLAASPEPSGTGVPRFPLPVAAAFVAAIFDPDLPESLVYDTRGGGKRLVAAMYMLKRATPLAEAPNIGGSLMQWHTHENLCYFPNGRLGGLTDGNGNCRAGLIKPAPTPMIHVWIEPHKCGPFAALEGIGGGTIAEGEEVLCDHAHGA